jgi:outer membrane protein assembly factor BamD (BamD/ComL family)
MKKSSFTFYGLALAFVFAAAAVPAAAQTGTVAKGPDASVTRDPDVEKAAMKNLEAARHYFKLKKAYYASRERAEEILVAFPDFTRTDEVLYIAGMSGLYLSEGKGKQPVPKSLPPERAEEYTPERLRASARFNLSRLVENHPDSKFRKDAEATLKLLGPEKQ